MKSRSKQQTAHIITNEQFMYMYHTFLWPGPCCQHETIHFLRHSYMDPETVDNRNDI